MDPCPFVRLIVESLALKLPPVTRPAGPGVHPSTTPCFCIIQLRDFPSSPPQTSPLNLDSCDSPAPHAATSASAPIVFSLDPSAVLRLASKPAALTISVYTGRTGTTCGFNAGRLLGRVRVVVDLDVESAAARPAVIKSGWAGVGSGGGRSIAWLHLVVRSEPDPRFVFQFGGEPECSPVVFQIGRGGGGCSARSGCLRQPAFSCRFSADRRRSTRSRITSSLPPDSSGSGRIKSFLLHSFAKKKRHLRREQRKGWTVTIHDLSGSPVAAASMITPFVPSPGSNRVSRANPGAWLILRPASPSSSNWKPWGRLEAWRERGPAVAIGYRFELVFESGPTAAFPIAESSISVRKGGEFRMDAASMGFVMESTVEGEGRVSRPEVQVGAQHAVCMGDAALFVALAAAVDLSMDACQPFSRKLRKELCHEQQEYTL